MFTSYDDKINKQLTKLTGLKKTTNDFYQVGYFQLGVLTQNTEYDCQISKLANTFWLAQQSLLTYSKLVITFGSSMHIVFLANIVRLILIQLKQAGRFLLIVQAELLKPLGVDRAAVLNATLQGL